MLLLYIFICNTGQYPRCCNINYISISHCLLFHFWKNNYYNCFITTLCLSPLTVFVEPCPTWWWPIWRAEACSSFYSKTNQIHQCIKFIYFRMTLYMFRMVSPTIIRSSRLYIHKQAFVTQILLSGRLQADSSICLVAVCTVLNSWWWSERPSETCRVSFQNK